MISLSLAKLTAGRHRVSVLVVEYESDTTSCFDWVIFTFAQSTDGGANACRSLNRAVFVREPVLLCDETSDK